MEHNSRYSKHSLHVFLNQRYLAIFIFLIITFVAVILFMRQSAMDDTTDYYMRYDAQVLSDFYPVNAQIAEFDAGYKEYYWGVQGLPLRYQQLIGVHNEYPDIKINETQLYQLDEKFVYILPYFSIEKDETFFVIHLFDLKNEAMFYQTWQNVFILAVLCCLFLVIFYSLRTNNRITQQMDDFHHWVKAMTRMNYQQLQQKQTPITLSFEELVNSANYLQISLLAQRDLQHKEQALLSREKHFLSCLSHELRTLISIISAALTLLKNSDDITAKDRAKLEKLSNANLTMKQLTNAILQLWHTQNVTEQNDVQNKLANKVFLLADMVELAVRNCQQQFSKRTLSFDINLDEQTKLFSQYELAEVLVNNLLRNACQYSVDGKVRVELRQHTLIVKNKVADVDTDNLSTEADDVAVSYGYGLGLFLAEKICQHQHWQLDINATEFLFTVTVNFSSTNEAKT